MQVLMDIKKDIDISKLNTLRVMAKAQLFACPKNLEEYKELFQYIKSENLAWHVLGAGSNLLLSSRDIPGIVISTNGMNHIERISDSVFQAGAGVRMPRFCARMTHASLSGAEFMEGIPGSLGGGITMNAGAHGSELAKILKEADVLNLETLELELWQNADFEFQYRNSKIDPSKYLLLQARFELEPKSKEEIREKVVHNNHARTSSQPIKSWTCGCTFKNPGLGIGAGRLIDELGLKGLTSGGFMVSNKHGNFFENQGGGTSMDFCQLMKQVQEAAFEQKQFHLIPEVQTMGVFNDEELSLWRAL